MNPGSFRQFLEGLPSRNPPWVAHALECVRYIVRRQTGPVDPEREAVLSRLEEWFFRDFDAQRGLMPRVFLPERARFGEPMTRTELAGEIEWYTAEHELNRIDAKIVWVSGDSSFFPDQATGTVGQAVHRAFESGVNIYFVYHGDASPAARSLEDFFHHNGSSPTDTLHRIDLTDMGEAPPSRWWQYSNPTLQFIYLGVGLNPRQWPEETLFILRGAETGEERLNRHSPLALEANGAEMTAFRAWMIRMGL